MLRTDEVSTFWLMAIAIRKLKRVPKENSTGVVSSQAVLDVFTPVATIMISTLLRESSIHTFQMKSY